MSSKDHITRTLVTIQCQPLDAVKILPRTAIKTENIKSGISNLDKSLPRVKSEFCDISIKSEFGNPSIINSSGEGTTGSINIGTIKIKSEFKVNSLASAHSSTIKPISIKTEDKYVPSSNNVYKKPLKMKKKKCKKELNDTEMIYRCCNMIFHDKFQHFEHMISHTEEMIRSHTQSKNVKCHYCPRFFKTESDMIRHAKSVHTGFSCSYCLSNFPKKKILLRHLERAHNKTVKNNLSYTQPEHLQWRKQTWHKHVDNKRVQKIKREESTSEIKIIPDIRNVKMETIPTNIKTEPSFSNVGNESIPSIKIETNH